ncbi:HAD family hydrolase [uncultured Jatrophihabitans sp.]|uniref:HAD family hydrolase n=1 Tax=uncultured Jatrophihabitans sp. TaxID=1610747 RepID=UPI0035CC6093
MTTLIATDLDQTLIYSRRALARWGGGGAVAAVEQYQGADASFLTADAAATLAHLADRALVVATTTRTPDQLARVRLPGASAAYAVAANGGVLLVDGRPDDDWASVVARRVAGSAPLAEVEAHARSVCRPEWTKLVRTAADLFCYAVLERPALPAGFVADEAAWAGERGWRVSLQGRKLYWVPASLTKSAAVAEIVRRTGNARVLAAGDSLLDADLLAAADDAIMARHGELYGSGWSAPHVAVTRGLGVAAGEEIVRWFSERCDDEVVSSDVSGDRAASRPDRDRPEPPRRARTAAG